MQRVRDAVRIGPISGADVAGTAGLAWLIAKWRDESFLKWFVKAVIAGEVVHLVLRIKTPVTQRLEEQSRRS